MFRNLVGMVCLVVSSFALASDPVELTPEVNTFITDYKWAVLIPGATASRTREFVSLSNNPFLAECSKDIGFLREADNLRGPIELAKANGTEVTVRIYDTQPDRQGGCFIQQVSPR